MRELKKIVIHCTATSRDVGVDEVRRWHVNRGFDDVGYHYLIRYDGTIEKGRDIATQGAHVRGENEDSIGVAYSGGSQALTGHDMDTRTPEQIEALKSLVNALLIVFPGLRSIHGHSEFSVKRCPCFDVRGEFGHLDR